MSILWRPEAVTWWQYIWLSVLTVTVLVIAFDYKSRTMEDDE